MLTAATKGATAASDTAVTYDDLVSLQASVDNAYGNPERGAFMMNSATLAAILKIVDKNGRPIFITDAQTGVISRILGRRVIINESMPDIAASAKPIAFGDFKYYHLRMVQGIRMTVFKEKYADKLEVGLHGPRPRRRQPGRCRNASGEVPRNGCRCLNLCGHDTQQNGKGLSAAGDRADCRRADAARP